MVRLNPRLAQVYRISITYLPCIYRMLFVCLTYVCLREPYCGGKFRENVGKALWGQKWDRVLDGGPDADKIEVTNSISI